jgi:hypothetical protein
MNENIFDLQSARTLFSKAQRVSLGFSDKPEFEFPFIYLSFRARETREAQQVLLQLSKALKKERLKIFINENGGDFLSVSFLWDSRGIIFSSSPDRYNKRECRDFRQNVLYGNTVKLFFCTESEGKEVFIKTKMDTIEINNLVCVYYEYIA